MPDFLATHYQQVLFYNLLFMRINAYFGLIYRIFERNRFEGNCKDFPHLTYRLVTLDCMCGVFFASNILLIHLLAVDINALVPIKNLH